MIRVELSDLVIGYEGVPLVDLGSRSLESGRVWVATGPNGSGKTTLLKTIAGILPPVSGVVSPRREPGRSGTTFVAATPWLFAGSVFRNLAIVGFDWERAEAALGVMGASELIDEPVEELSTGQVQRVALARAIALEPEVLLVDEPERGLDAGGIELWHDYLVSSLRNQDTLVLVASHHPELFSGSLAAERIDVGT